jgi:hypothetical protein
MKFRNEVFGIFPGGLESLNDEVFCIFIGRSLSLTNMGEKFNLNMITAKNHLVSSLSGSLIHKREVI